MKKRGKNILFCLLGIGIFLISISLFSFKDVNALEKNVSITKTESNDYYTYEIKDYERGHFTLIMPSGCDFTLNPSLFFDAFEKYSGEETERLDIVRTGILCKDGTQFE